MRPDEVPIRTLTADDLPDLAGFRCSTGTPWEDVVEYISWFSNDRLHESLDDVSPAEFESLYVAQEV